VFVFVFVLIQKIREKVIKLIEGEGMKIWFGKSFLNASKVLIKVRERETELVSFGD
jgi:hypothetical protein